MAVYPCDYSRHRYREPQQSLYWTEISEHLISTYKVRLCPKHFAEVFAEAQTRMDNIELDSQISEKCQHCGGDRHFTCQARLFPAHQDEVQLLSDLCAACTSKLGNDLRIYNGERLRGPGDG